MTQPIVLKEVGFTDVRGSLKAFNRAIREATAKMQLFVGRISPEYYGRGWKARKRSLRNQPSGGWFDPDRWMNFRRYPSTHNRKKRKHGRVGVYRKG